MIKTIKKALKTIVFFLKKMFPSLFSPSEEELNRMSQAFEETMKKHRKEVHERLEKQIGVKK